MKTIFIAFLFLSALGSNAQNQASTSGGDHIYTHVQQMPQFPGGNKALAQQLTDSIDLLPVKWEELKDDDFNLSIKLSFVIDEQGNVSDVKVLRSMNVINDAKLVSAVKKMKFTPGMQDGKPVKVLYILPFDYVIPPR